MAQFARLRPVTAAATRAVAVAVLLLRPAPTSGAVAHGRFTHGPNGEAVPEGYEVKDLPAKGSAYALATLGVSAAVLVGIVFALIRLFTSWDAQSVATLTTEQVAPLTPPAPRLQTAPFNDLHREMAREQQALEGYAWLDPGHTRAHIPIDRAMGVVTGHSLDDAP
jgi:hypothetical protein